jgi:hypothetical protein
MAELQWVLDGTKPGAYLGWMSWPYVKNHPALDGVPLYDHPDDPEPSGVAIARKGTLVSNVIGPADVDFFADLDPHRALPSAHKKLRDLSAVRVLALNFKAREEGAALDQAQRELVDEFFTGLLLGYPRCCVKYYAEVYVFNRPKHYFHDAGFMNDCLYLQCEECVKAGRVLYHQD